MKFESVRKILKNGEEIVLCSPEIEDAAGCAYHANTISHETQNLVISPEDGEYTVEHEIEWINRFLEAGRDAIILAKLNGVIVGLANISAKSNKFRLRHRAGFGISVQSKYWGLGIGNALMEQSLDLAKSLGFEQVELSVMKDNTKAQNLYKKFGFKEYGIYPNMLKYADDNYSDSIFMVKMLDK